MAKGRASRGRQVRAEVGDQRPPQPEKNPDDEKSQAQPRTQQLTSLQQQQLPQDDIEDEAWDTSMVAEYGDDIFEYMHKLEVRFGRL